MNDVTQLEEEAQEVFSNFKRAKLSKRKPTKLSGEEDMLMFLRSGRKIPKCLSSMQHFLFRRHCFSFWKIGFWKIVS